MLATVPGAVYFTPKGRVRTVNVEDPALQAKLASLKPGQVVQFDYTEAVAADIRPATN